METYQSGENKEIQPVVEKKKRGFWAGMLLGVIATLLVVAVVCTGLFLYRYVQMQQTQQNAAGTVADTTMQMKLKTIEQIIDFYYYKDDVDEEALSDGVYRGMMDAIGDP